MDHFAYFWDHREPYNLKADLEKRSATVLSIEQQNPITYAGSRVGTLEGRMVLRFEASTTDGFLYSLRFTNSGSDSDRAFQYWLNGTRVVQDPGPVEFAAGERYRELASKAAALEGQQSRREDPASISAAQQKVLAKLRAGRRYAVGHHEGITAVRMLKNNTLMKKETGECPSEEVYTGDEEILRFLRTFFDYEANKETHPRKRAELEVWIFIEAQFH